MLDTSTKLTVLYYNGSTYTDYSNKFFEPAREAQVIQVTDSDYIYVGFSKPINKLYLDLSVANTTASTMTVEYYNDSVWASVSNLYDDTRGCTRNGFIQWDYIDVNDVDKTTIDSKELFWYRISFSTTLHSTTSFNCFTMIFADDQDLKREFISILDDSFFAESQASHFLVHVSTRDYIVQQLRNKGYYKIDSSGYRVLLTAWDLFDNDEIRQAAVYFALSRIFESVSDNPEDHNQFMAEKYLGRGHDALKQVSNLSIDLDDDGFKDSGERLTKSKMARWSR